MRTSYPLPDLSVVTHDATLQSVSVLSRRPVLPDLSAVTHDATLESVSVLSRLPALPVLSRPRETAIQCLCTVDPMVTCPIHPCDCGVCARPRSNGERCQWQKRHSDYIAHNDVDIGASHSAFTALHDVPFRTRSMRSRVNILCRQMENLPPREWEMLVFDNSQSIGMCSPRHDGCLPTFCSRSLLYVPSANKGLRVWDLTVIMGFHFRSHVQSVMSASAWRARIGNTMHTVVVAVVMLCSLLPCKSVFPSAVPAPRPQPLTGAIRSHPARLLNIARQLLAPLRVLGEGLHLRVGTDCSHS